MQTLFSINDTMLFLESRCSAVVYLLVCHRRGNMGRTEQWLNTGEDTSKNAGEMQETLEEEELLVLEREGGRS